MKVWEYDKFTKLFSTSSFFLIEKKNSEKKFFFLKKIDFLLNQYMIVQSINKQTWLPVCKDSLRKYLRKITGDLIDELRYILK